MDRECKETVRTLAAEVDRDGRALAYSEVRHLQEAGNRAMDLSKFVFDTLDHSEAQERRIEELRGALTFYASREAYLPGNDEEAKTVGERFATPIVQDEGKLARKVLG